MEPWCKSLAHTKRAALLSRLQDGVFEPLLEGTQYKALANMETQQLATCLFDLGLLAPCLLPDHLHVSPIGLLRRRDTEDAMNIIYEQCQSDLGFEIGSAGV